MPTEAPPPPANNPQKSGSAGLFRFPVEKSAPLLYNLPITIEPGQTPGKETKDMKLGIEGDSPDPISQYYSINTDNS